MRKTMVGIKGEYCFVSNYKKGMELIIKGDGSVFDHSIKDTATTSDGCFVNSIFMRSCPACATLFSNRTRQLLYGCGSTRHYAAFQYDNGNDYVSEGLYRIVDRKGRIGYADESGRTVIKTRFAFGYPFEGVKAKVTDSGKRKEVVGSGGEHWIAGITSTRKGNSVGVKPGTGMEYIHERKRTTPKV